MINSANADISKTNIMCLKYVFHDFGNLLKNSVSENLRYACCLLQLNMYHTMRSGMIISPNRKCGDANSIELILFPPFLGFQYVLQNHISWLSLLPSFSFLTLDGMYNFLQQKS